MHRQIERQHAPFVSICCNWPIWSSSHAQPSRGRDCAHLGAFKSGLRQRNVHSVPRSPSSIRSPPSFAVGSASKIQTERDWPQSKKLAIEQSEATQAKQLKYARCVLFFWRHKAVYLSSVPRMDGTEPGTTVHHSHSLASLPASWRQQGRKLMQTTGGRPTHRSLADGLA